MAPRFMKKERNAEEIAVTFKHGDDSVKFAIEDFVPGFTAATKGLKNVGLLASIVMHGLSEKGSNAYSDAKGNGASAMKMLRDEHEKLSRGVWSERGTGDGSPRRTILFDAILELRRAMDPNYSEETLEAKLAEMSDAQKAELKEHPQIQEKITAITARRAAERAKKAKAAAKEVAGKSLDELFS